MHIIDIIPAIRAILTKVHIRPVIQFTDDVRVFNLLKDEKSFFEALNNVHGLFLKRQKNDNLMLQDFIRIQSESGFETGLIALENSGILGVGNSWEETDHHINELLRGTTVSIADEESKSARLRNKIVVVTGGAQGFGKGIVEEIIFEGAYVVIADINEKVGNQTVEEINSRKGKKHVIFVKTDVTTPASVKNMLGETVKEFGGLDMLISNAGVLRAGALEEMDEETFDFVTDVNYKGYYICAKYCSEIMKLQHAYNKSIFTDIIQINSKSGLEGSNKNFAYAGSKFGAIGLTQSFAKELVDYNIKVNSICPGNYFEGPLWSDPETGLFSQYLKTGKVPGAKSIDDVRRAYESKVPMKRGCTPKDIVRAIYYLADQEYETGQALPVTGGQIMLN